MKLALIEFLKKAWKGGWKFIDIVAHILIVYIFTLNVILTIPFCTRSNDFYKRFLYTFLIFLKFSSWTFYIVCYTALFSVVTQHSSPITNGEERCVTTLKTHCVADYLLQE